MKDSNKYFRWLIAVALSLSVVFSFVTPASAVQNAEIALKGQGTSEDPYLIQTAEDLFLFAEYVNQGKSFEGCYVYQTENIDLCYREWMPIGLSEEETFMGIYDGGGHYIENLYVPYREDEATTDSSDDEKKSVNFNGFFGSLGGTVVNLGIESGLIRGDYCGSIASYGVGQSPAILNCYSKATVQGLRAGGIADQLNHGVIACSWFDGVTNATLTKGLLSWSGDVKVYHAYTTGDRIAATSDIYSPTSAPIERETLYSDNFLVKLNLSTAFSQYLYANEKGVTLKQWDLDHSGDIRYTEETGYLNLLGFINLYFLPLLLVILCVGYGIAFLRVGKAKIWQRYHKDIIAIAVISGIVSLFVDMAIIGKGLSYLNLGNGLFVVLINTIFITSLAFSVKESSFRLQFKKEWLPLTIAILAVSVLELFQFDLVPKFDAQIYYGSLVKAIDLFQVDFLTYIGAFVCWKWLHGLVLLIAPLEFLIPGQMIGIYVGNMVINAVTMVCMYWLQRKLCPGTTPLLATFGSLILILCPYQLGLFTYLCMDGHTALFLVWLLCSYVKRNPIFVAFCGYLLAFNKITGLVFYVFFLLTMGLIEILRTEGKSFFHKVLKWWNWKTVVLWIAPAFLYLLTMILGDDLTIQNFYGAYMEASYGIKGLRSLFNTFVQSFGYGFRWVFVLVFLSTVALLLFKRRKLEKVITLEGVFVVVAAIAGCAGVLLVLCLYRGDADCPRYTALLNLFYALSFPICIQIFTDKKGLRNFLTGGMVAVLLIQTYWTIDPLLILTSETIDTGKKKMYELVPPGDYRAGMSIGETYGLGYGSVTDLYTYNLEHSFYDDLLDQALTEIQPDEDLQFVQLDVMWYELQLYGNKYPIYWNTRTNNRTYDAKDPDSIFLWNQLDATTQEIYDGEAELESSFCLLVPARVDSEIALEALAEQGYRMVYELHPKNIYGSMTVYGFELSENEER